MRGHAGLFQLGICINVHPTEEPMKKAVMYFGESVLAPYRYNTEWPEWAQGSFREAVMYYLKENDPVLGLLCLRVCS